MVFKDNMKLNFMFLLILDLVHLVQHYSCTIIYSISMPFDHIFWANIFTHALSLLKYASY